MRITPFVGPIELTAAAICVCFFVSCNPAEDYTETTFEGQGQAIHLAGQLSGYQHDETRFSVGEDSHEILPSFAAMGTFFVDSTASWENGTVPLDEFLSHAKVDDEAQLLLFQTNSRHGSIEQTVALSAEPTLGAETVDRVRLIPETKSNGNILANAGFEGFATGYVPAPWLFDTTPEEGPRIGGRTDQPREGRFLIELLPRSDGEPTRLVQQLPAVLTSDSPVTAEFTAWLRASAPDAFFVEILREDENGVSSIGQASHPGDGEWHAVSVTAEIAQPRSVRALHAVIRREQVEGVGETLIDDTEFLAPDVVVLGAQVKFVAQPVREMASQQLRIPADARLEAALAAFRPFSDAPQTQAVALQLIVEDDAGMHEAASHTVEIPQNRAESSSWKEVTFDLSRWAGQSVRLHFRSDADESATVIPLWGSVVLTSAPPERRETPPNVILISLDTLRADRLGAYGYDKDSTPHLDAFARSSHLFENCMAVSSWTTPSHATVFTGEMPSVHGAGIARSGSGHRSQLPDAFTTIAEAARTKGYRTAAFTEGFFVASRWGLAQGFERYYDGSGEVPTEKVVEHTFDRARTWLDTRQDSPFLLFVHTYGPHWPYTPPAEYLERFAGTANPEFPPGDRLLAGDLTPQEFQLLSDTYDAGIAYVDDVVGEFFAYLEDSGLMDNSYIIIFSDHGEELGEHGGAMHGLTLYNEVLHVPLIIRTPGQAQGARYSELVGIGGIYGTALDMLGIPSAEKPSLLDPAARGRNGDSIQLAELIHHVSEHMHFAAQTSEEKVYLVSPFGHGDTVFPESIAEFEENFGIETLIRLIDAAGKDPATHKSLRREFYRLIEDSTEQKELFSSQGENAQALLRRAREALEDAQKLSNDSAEVDLADPLTPEEREQFDAIGYVQD